MLKKTSLYSSLAFAVISAFMLLSYAVLVYLPFPDGEALLLKHNPLLTTDTWAVFDTTTGDIQYGKNIETVRPIASITKLFTAYMVLYTDGQSAETTITQDDINTEGAFGKLKSGETLTLGSLMFPLLLESSNDAGTAIARTFGPLYAEAVGWALSNLNLTDTRIVDGTGLSQEDVSSPRDLARFFTLLKGTYPHITDITQLRVYITNKRGLVNNNPARAFSNFTGGKQGFTPEAGKTFVGSFILPKSNREVGIVLLGSKDLGTDIGRILVSLR
jgi:D-alanyl-D-alanine endopeptidase (penicillin-binding protein 7)